MAKRKRRRTGLERIGADVFGMVTSARDASRAALENLRKELAATRRYLERLVAEERSFRLDLFGAGGAPRTRAARRPRPRKGKPRRRGPAKADAYLRKLPKSFTIEDVRKVAGKAAGVSLAQWARAKKVKKTARGYAKTV